MVRPGRGRMMGDFEVGEVLKNETTVKDSTSVSHANFMYV